MSSTGRKLLRSIEARAERLARAEDAAIHAQQRREP